MNEERKKKKVILQTKEVNVRFGGLRALRNVSLDVREGALHSIIGPNGAGKTTLFNILSGFLPPTSGKIYFDGRDITALKPYRISQLGLSRSYQITNIFLKLTVLENVRIAVQSRSPKRFGLFRSADRLSEIGEESKEVLGKIGLLEQGSKLAGELSHGDQRALEVGIALATGPKVLLLDEPTSGMSPHETKSMIQLIRKISADQTILLIEHNMSVVMTVSDRITVLQQGEVIADGTPIEVKNNVDVKRAYLGGMADAQH